jgi:hypothetical protein
MDDSDSIHDHREVDPTGAAAQRGGLEPTGNAGPGLGTPFMNQHHYSLFFSAANYIIAVISRSRTGS